MENVQRYQIIFIIVGIFILIYLTYLVYRRHTALIEPDEITDAINDAIDRVKRGMEDVFNQVMDTLMKPINSIIDFVNKIKDFFNSLGTRFNNMYMALDHFGSSFGQAFKIIGDEMGAGFEGINDGFIKSFRLLGTELEEEIIHNMGDGFKELSDITFADKNKGLTKLFTSFGKLITDIQYLYNYIKSFFGTYIYNYINCGFDKITNFPKCALFYLIDLFYGIFFYLPVTTMVFFLNYFFCINAQPQLDAFMAGIECLDEAIRPFLGGYSLIHYSDSVLDTCYECRKVTPPPESPLHFYIEDAKQIHDELKQMPKDMNNALNRIAYGANRIPGAFNDAFELLGFQLKESLEMIGMSFPDGMNALKTQLEDAGHDFKQQFSLDHYNDLRWKDTSVNSKKQVPFYYSSLTPASK